MSRCLKSMAGAHLEAVGGSEGGLLVTLHHRHRALDDHEALGVSCTRTPAVFTQDGEGRRAAVHDRHLGPVQLDAHVVDAQARERREQVLHRAHLTPSLPSVVASEVSTTNSLSAGMATGRARSVRTNTMPWLAGAGRSVSVTGAPECSPTALRGDHRVERALIGPRRTCCCCSRCFRFPPGPYLPAGQERWVVLIRCART